MDTAERRATAGLWSIQGIGPVTLSEICARVGPLGELLEKPVSSWAPLIPWRGETLAYVMAVGTVARAADRLEKTCRAQAVRILFSGDPAFPNRLPDISKPPAVLFAHGPCGEGPPRRRLAIVGTRYVDKSSLERLAFAAREAAGHGLCIVSGAAWGCDTAAHEGALAAKGETWAFHGSALDQLDPAPLRLSQEIVASGGSIFSEFPPGFRANLNSFTLRNRLIAGASDAVLIFRAPVKSGALSTAECALEQRKPLLATPGDPWNPSAMGSNALLQSRKARPHIDFSDLWEAVGLGGSISPQEPVPMMDLTDLSPLAAEVLAHLARGAADFEELLVALPSVDSGHLSAALVELEVFGAVLHKGGRRYEKR